MLVANVSRLAVVAALLVACSPPPARPAASPPAHGTLPARSAFAAGLDRALAANDVTGALAQLAALPPTGLYATEVQDVVAAHWAAIVETLTARGTATSAYFALAKLLPPASLDAPLRGLVATLAERAADAEIELARAAKGPGGAWLHATLAARIAGGKPPRVAAATLDAATRIDLDFMPVPASCSWVDGPARRDGRRVVVTTSGLSCTAEPVRITGTVTLRWEPAGEQHVVVDVASPIGAEAVRTLHATLVRAAALPLAEAAHALALAALAAKDLATAEDQLVLHARFASPAPELAEVMLRYGVSYSEL